MLMDLPTLKQKWGLQISGVLHLGAHLCEEAPIYNELGISRVWWVEACRDILAEAQDNIRPFPGQQLIHALIYDKDDAEIFFNVTNHKSMSSSILEWGTHPTFSPDTIFVDRVNLRTSTVDTLMRDCGIRANFLNMDLQGAELHALRGAVEFLNSTNAIMTEVNKDEVYEGCAKVWELDEFLSDFQRVETHWVGKQGWGDALYLRVKNAL